MIRSRLHCLAVGLAVGLALALALACAVASSARAADHLRIAALKTGTLAWELGVMKARGLDKAADLDIETIDLASPEAGKIALQGGGADMIVSDWLWVARERGLGDKLLFAPYSSAPGAVMVSQDSPIHAIGDLAGHSLGVAGGPLDKNWLLLQAAARRSGLDLAHAARPQYGAPPLIAEKLAQGEFDAALEFWNSCADLEIRGFRRVIEMADVEKQLGAAGPVSMTGYVFSESFAATHSQALGRYFAAAAKAREILAADASAWGPIRTQLHLKDEAALDLYRRRYLDGAAMRPVAEEAADAKALFHALADVGGKDLVGDVRELDTSFFYDAKRGG
jgi:NitT/TauT family transport system substrate-binding protein